VRRDRRTSERARAPALVRGAAQAPAPRALTLPAIRFPGAPGSPDDSPDRREAHHRVRARRLRRRADRCGCRGGRGAAAQAPARAGAGGSRGLPHHVHALALGQLSKFVQPGAFRIDSPHFVSYTVTPRDFATASPGLDDVAFLNPDGSKILVAYNNDRSPVSFAVRSRGRYFAYRLRGWAMATFVWDRPAGTRR
jgi:hypothetical protein